MRAIAIAIAVAGGIGCAELPDLGECGNGVVEPQLGEACDDGGDSDACTETCELWCLDAPAGDYVEVGEVGGVTAYCPDGYGCGDDFVCRAPEGRFYRVNDPVAFDADQVHVGDVNDDGVVDLIGLSATEIRVRYGDPFEPLGAESALAAPIVTGRAYAGPLSPDSSTDLLVPTLGGVVKYLANDGVLAHSVEPTLVEGQIDDPVAPLSIVSANGFELLLGAAIIPDVDPGPGVQPVAVVVDIRGGDMPMQTMPLGICVLPTDSTYEAIRRHPFAKVALPTGDRFALIVDRTGVGADDLVCVWQPLQIELSPTQNPDPAIVHDLTRDLLDTGIVFADVDGDACAELAWPRPEAGGVFDVMYLDDTGAAGCPYGPIGSIDVSSGRLIDAGDLDGANRDELITSSGILQYFQGAWQEIHGADWRDAVTADIDGDGRRDVAATPALGEDFTVLRTAGVAVNGQIMFAPNTAQTAGQVAGHGLVVGDYDGDGIDDLAISERRASDVYALTLAWGSPTGVLDLVEVASFDDAELVLIRMGPALYTPDEINPLGSDAIDDLAVALVSTGALDVAMLFGTPHRGLTAPLWVDGGMGPGSSDVKGTIAYDFVGGDGVADAFMLGSVRAMSGEVESRSWLWQGEGDGTFDTEGEGDPTGLAPETGNFPSALAVVAAANDGGIHVASADGAGAIAIENTAGSCPDPTTIAIPGLANASPILRAVDVDGVPGDELVASFTSQTGGAAFLVDAMPGSCSAPPRVTDIAMLAGTMRSCVDAAAIDLDLEPRTDLVALCVGGIGSEAGRVVGLVHDGDTFAPSEHDDNLDGRAKLVAVGDFTGDGVDDVAVITEIASVPTLHLLVQCTTTTSDEACPHDGAP
jgi:hypothetical protein